jgi:hypothetical protein
MVFGPSFGPLCAFLCTAGSPNYSHIASKVKFWSGSEKEDLDFSMYSFFDKVNNKALLLQNISGFLSSNKIQQIKCLTKCKEISC